MTTTTGRAEACRTCQAPVVWATTVPRDPSKKASTIPLDPGLVDPRDRGALACVPDEQGRMFAYGRTLLVQRLARAEQLTEREALLAAFERFEWRVAHFATCPDADQHRTRR